MTRPDATTFHLGPEAASEQAWGASDSDGRARRGKAQRILQFTDLHLFAEPDQQLLGHCTRRSFEQVLELAQAKHWPPHAILLTGDLVHDERAQGYRYLRQRIDGLGCTCFCIPGNHDRPDLLAAEVEPGADRDLRVERLGPWYVLLLDSTVRGTDVGRLRPHTLTALAEHLASAPQRPTLVALHHQPVPIGSRWLDTMQVENGADLIALAGQYSQLRAIVWGHVHQAFDRQVDSTRLLSTPSTCAQFAPRADDFAQDGRRPGYRWIELEPDGNLRTGVERLPAGVQAHQRQPLKLAGGQDSA